MEAWQGSIGEGGYYIRRQNFKTRAYSLKAFVVRVTSVRITGKRCKIQFKDDTEIQKCELEAGDHEFPKGDCKDNEITQYTVIEGPQGKILM